MIFYLGTPREAWLHQVQVPLFMSRRVLDRSKKLKPATCDWALDSGGFTELSMFGEWRTTPTEYIAGVRRYQLEAGRLQWAAPQDAMCEPWILEKSRHWLGGTIEAHQRWTVDNYLELRTRAADLPFIPVLQGWLTDDYWRHIDMYLASGVDLTAEPVVGLGSVCRRQATSDIAELVGQMWSAGLRLHGFGIKTNGLSMYGDMLVSADSQAWNLTGYRITPCSKTPNKKSCANCQHFALEWRDNVLAKAALSVGRPAQMALAFGRSRVTHVT